MTEDGQLAHGLAGDQSSPDWPPLEGGEVAALLERYPRLGALQSVHWRSPRPLSAAALVRTRGGEVFVKRHHRTVRTPATLGEEHRFAAHIRHRGIPVPHTHFDEGGHSVVEMGDWVYEVHDAAQGVDVYRDAFSWSPIDGPAHAFAAGAMLAQLHVAANDYLAPQRATHILVARAETLASADPVATLAAQLPVRSALATFLAERDWKNDIARAVAPWHERAVAGIARQPRLWTHGDWHVSNLCWSGADEQAHITDVLDLGLAAATFALFDLATAIERNAIAWLAIERGDIAHADIALALMDGYLSIPGAPRVDKAVLADVLPIVHLDFALSEVEYYQGIVHRRDHAEVAYHTFLRGHAAWFEGVHGKALLDTIRDTG